MKVVVLAYMMKCIPVLRKYISSSALYLSIIHMIIYMYSTFKKKLEHTRTKEYCHYQQKDCNPSRSKENYVYFGVSRHLF
jgi:hypothetical protein